MNERIQQLAEQAANEYLAEMESVTDTLSTAKRAELAQKAKQAGIGIIPHGFSEKFAELIVKECVSILMKPEYAMNHPGELADYNRGWVNGRLLGIEHIEGYFGVEQ